MAGPVALTQSCCHEPCTEPENIQVPGPAGDDGQDGAPGTNGISPVTTTTAQFLMPAEGANVTVGVVTSEGFVPGQNVYVQTAGYMEVVSKPGNSSVILKNLENTASSLYTGNAAPTTAIPAGSLVSTGGIQGPAPSISGAAGGHLKGTYPNPTIALNNAKGALIVGDGADSDDLTVGTNGNSLEADSTQALGVKWAPKNLAGGANHVTGALPIANGGTGQTTANPAFNALSPVTTRGDLIYRNATVNARLALGTTGQVLGSNGTDPVWAKLVAANLGTALLPIPVDYILLEYRLGSGTAGGTFTSGSWVTRELNLEAVDTGSWGTLAANQYTLNSNGTYRFRARACGYKCDNHQVRIQNITAGTTIASGGNARSAAAGDDLTWSEAIARIALVGPVVIELQHQCQTTRATDGRGLASSFGINEVYAQMEIWREAT